MHHLAVDNGPGTLRGIIPVLQHLPVGKQTLNRGPDHGHGERLGEICVRAGVHSLDLVLFRNPGRTYDDRYASAVLVRTELSHKLESVILAVHNHVSDNEIRHRLLQYGLSLPRSGSLNNPVGIRQCVGKQPADILIVIHNENHRQGSIPVLLHRRHLLNFLNSLCLIPLQLRENHSELGPAARSGGNADFTTEAVYQ